MQSRNSYATMKKNNEKDTSSFLHLLSGAKKNLSSSKLRMQQVLQKRLAFILSRYHQCLYIWLLHMLQGQTFQCRKYSNGCRSL